MTIHSLKCAAVRRTSVMFSCALLYSHVALAADALSLSDFLKAAVATNETSRINATQEAQFSAKKDESAATMMPQVKAVGNYSRLDDSENKAIDPNSSLAKINLTQPLLGLFKNRSAIDFAQQQYDVTVLGGEDAILQMKLALSDAFHAVLSAKSDVENYTEVQLSATKRVKEIRARVKIGQSRPADLYSAQAQLAVIDAQLEQAKTAEINARSTLAQLSGLPANTLVIDSVKLPEKFPMVEGFLKDTAALPSIKVLEAQKKSADLQADIARAQRIPDLDFVANYYLKRDQPLDKVKWDVGLQLSWSIYDGGLIPAKVRESQALHDMYDYQLVQKKRLTELKIRQSYEQFSANTRQIPIFENAVELAQKSYDSIYKDYKLGLTTILEVIQSYNAVADAKRQHNHQIIGAKAALVALQLNAGQKI